ncbi:MAG: copper chaperone PCu(A)C [Magnetococcales bacterium]|nr:copper chaperone PCu(A)C [Magnetococcales bacterium]
MKIFHGSAALAAGALALLLAGSAFSETGGVVVDKAWVRAYPPGIQVTAAYMVVKNTSDQPAVLVGISCSDFAKTEIHETVQHQGQAHMQAVKELAIPAHGEVVLKPGGHHLMLIAPQKDTRPHAGDRMTLTLTFKDGKNVPVQAVVRKDAEGKPAAGEHSQHAH